MTYVALLRGINVGGNKLVAMADLRAALTALGYSGVATLLQSGNTVFSGVAAKPATIEAQIEKALAARFGFSIDVHVRTADEVDAVIAANPFTREAKDDPARLIVTFFRAPLAADRIAALQAAIPGRERLRADGRHLYMTFPDGMGNSKAAPLVDRLLGMRGTARNWNTVLKLAAAARTVRPS